jgi:hypothetical protein
MESNYQSVTDDDDLIHLEVDNPGGIDYDRWVKALAPVFDTSGCRKPECRRCRERGLV